MYTPMKKTIIIIASLLCATGISAQVQWGVRLGANCSRYDAPKFFHNATAKWGPTIGATAFHTLTSWLDVQADLTYTQRNCEDKTFIIDMDTEEHFCLRMHYLTLPLQLKFFHPTIADGANIHFGPQLSILLYRDTNFDKDILAQTNPLDFGFAAGLGWLSPTGYFIDADLYLGLTSIYKSAQQNTVLFQNRSLQITVGKYF